MTKPARREPLERLYAAKSSQELAEAYNSWAEEFDRDMLSYGYKTPAVIAGLLGRYVRPQDGLVLDAGAGTGILGETLTLLGYKDLVAIDFSRGMLEAARRKDVYRDLRQMVLGSALDFPDATFGATVATSVFTTGHRSPPPGALDELARVTAPRGYIIFSVRADVYLNGGFKEKQEALERSGKWRLVEMTPPFPSFSLTDPGDTTQAFAYQVS